METFPLPFTKMQALGNDFVVLETQHLKSSLRPDQIRFIADRRLGIGCDQLILISTSQDADTEVSFYNADGSMALACGNGTRCVAHFLGKETGSIQTPSHLCFFEKSENEIAITLKEPIFGKPFSIAESPDKVYPVDVGNPHLVLFVKDLEAYNLNSLALSLQPPEGVNVELAQILSPNTIRVKVWERGVGPTPACGSGACAVGMVALKSGLIKSSPALIKMEGGDLKIDWTEGTPPLLMGPAFTCFKGMITLP